MNRQRLCYYLPLLLFVLVSHTCIADRTTVEEYVDKYKEIAVREMHRTGIPASIKLGQGIMESDAGNSELSQRSNNHFGIKCKTEWTGSTYYHIDDDKDKHGNLIKSCFRAYRSPEDSYVDHSQFLKNRDRYAFLFAYHQTDYQQWAYGLKSAGYATADHYATKLVEIIERYQLHQYDYYPSPDSPEWLTMNQPTFTEEAELMVLGNSFHSLEIVPSSTDTELPVFTEPFPISTPPLEVTVLFPVQEKEVFTVNGLSAVAFKNQTLEQIAEKYQVKYRKLLKINELESDSDLIEGQYIYLNKKKKTGEDATAQHTVRTGETMYSIAQRYGIRLKSLYQLNRMKSGQQPALGAVLHLNQKAETTPPLAAQ